MVVVVVVEGADKIVGVTVVVAAAGATYELAVVVEEVKVV